MLVGPLHLYTMSIFKSQYDLVLCYIYVQIHNAWIEQKGAREIKLVKEILLKLHLML